MVWITRHKYVVPCLKEEAGELDELMWAARQAVQQEEAARSGVTMVEKGRAAELIDVGWVTPDQRLSPQGCLLVISHPRSS